MLAPDDFRIHPGLVHTTAHIGHAPPRRLAAGLVLHAERGGYTEEADAALCGAGLSLEAPTRAGAPRSGLSK